MSHFHPHGKPEEPAKSLAEFVREAHGWCRDFDYHKTLPNGTRCGSMYHAAITAALRKAVEVTREEDVQMMYRTGKRIAAEDIRSLPMPEGLL